MPGTPPIKLLLEQSINTDTPDYDIRPFDPEVGPAPHIRNNGIERNGGIKNAYQTTYTKSAGVAVQYTKAGKRVELTVATGAVTVDGVSVGSVYPTYGADTPIKVPGNPDDAISIPGGVLTLNPHATNTTIEKWLYSAGAWSRVDASTVTVAVGLNTSFNFRFARNLAGISDIADITHITARSGNDFNIITVATSATLFTHTAPAVDWESHTYHSGATAFYFTKTRPSGEKYFWTWSSTGPTLTSYLGYGDIAVSGGKVIVFRNLDDAIAAASDVIGLEFTIGSTTSSNITLAYTPTVKQYSISVWGAIFASYTHSGGTETEILYAGASGGTRVSIAAVRCYCSEMVGVLGAGIGAYTVNQNEAYLGGFGGYGATAGGMYYAGALVSEVGAMDNKYQPYIYSLANGTAYRRADGTFEKVGFLSGSDNRMTSIDHDVVLVNTLFGPNVVNAQEMTLEYGPSAFNGASIAEAPASTSTSTIFATQYAGKYGAGVDTGEKILTNTGNGGKWYSIGELSTGPTVDFYVNSVYYKSGYAHAGIIYSIQARTEGLDRVYIQDTRLPVPAGSIISQGAARFSGKIAILDEDYAGYMLGNEVGNMAGSFLLFGERWLYDSDTIYRATVLSSGAIQSFNKVTQANGLTFLAVTPTEAWFLSAWDNSLWTFNGGRNVEKKIRLNAKDAIAACAYCGASNELVLYESAGKSLYIRDGIITETTLSVTATGTVVLQPDINGVWIIPQGGAGNIAQLRYNSSGATKIDLDFQTAYHGLEFWKKATFKEYVFTIYDPAKTAGALTGTWYSFDELGPRTAEARTFTLSYDTNGLARISFIPAQGQAIAGSIRLQASTPMTVLDGYAYIEDNDARIISENRGA